MTRSALAPALALGLLLAPVAVLAQEHDHAAMAEAAPAAPTAADPHAGHDMSAMTEDMSAHAMTGGLGDYPMTRDASGTAWQPDSAPMEGVHGQAGGWTTMLHGYAAAIYDDQGGPRGDRQTVVTSMLMSMAQRPAAGGTVTLRGMLSLDPMMGKRGYPLLLATGETADGRTELVDRQHPHDAFMELAVLYSRPLGERTSGFVYLGLPGEPALGPATFMHRFSGAANPEAPIGHHWLDSTHVTFGVATAGVVHGRFKLEASRFTGREPDQDRWDIERPRFDSWAARATWNASENVSLQVSHGRLRSPEALHPEENVRRTTASLTYGRPLGDDRRWQGTLAWGRNDPRGGHDGHVTDAWLAEAALQLGRNTVFGRAERVEKDELFGEDHANPLVGRVFKVGKLSLGAFHSLPFGPLTLDLGGLVSRYALPSAIRPAYGEPTSGMLFARFRIAG